MRTITDAEVELIDAVLAEKASGGLTPAILEKDIHVTDVLHFLTDMAHPTLSLVFCGGTSLSKAHGIIARMSEDVDFKIILANEHGLSRNAIRNQLKELNESIIAKMKAMGFTANDTGFVVRNEYRYFATAWLYKRHYESVGSLRPHLSLEFTLRTPQFPTTQKPIGRLVDQLAEIEGKCVPLSCIAIEETLAEKVLSFLRRHAQHRSDNMAQPWDPALVRHIYDVFCIANINPNALENAKFHFKALVQFDAEEFTQHIEFVRDPRTCLLAALTAAEVEKQTRDEYQTSLLPLIYGETKPDFAQAFQVFKKCSIALIDTL